VRLGVDAKCLLPPRAGIARYLEGVLEGLEATAPDDLTVELLQPRRPRRTLPWVIWDLRRASAHGLDVLHCPFYYPPPAPRCPVTVAIHDLLVLEHPEWFRPRWGNTLRLMIPRGARRADAVITGSRSVADALVAECGVARERIRLIGYGLDHRRFAPPDAAQVTATLGQFGLDRPYLLQVGAIEPRRGVDLAIGATAVARTTMPELELIVVGEPRALVAALEAPPPWLRRLGRVGDAVLPALYAGSEAVLAPSRGEGFDFPVLEALACGAVVVASDIPVHVEHFDGAVELFAAGSSESLAAALGRVRDDSGLRGRLRAAGPPLAARFRWDEAARLHLELWREVAGR
jgi:glycosyltransferase involved in cell wall biosynthesis